MKTCLIITGGSLDLTFARSFCSGQIFDKIIAVDGGLKAAKSLGLVPDIIEGDFDTAEPSLLEEFKQIPYIVWDIHKPEKNETDMELALLKAMAYGCTHITILGAMGGRFDHMLANVFLLYHCLQQGVEACIIDRQNKIYLIEEHHVFSRSKQWGTYISFLPLSGELKGITLEGFRYPLLNYDLEAASSRCISNELIQEKGTITIREGVAICVESAD